ncbi:MAG: helix-turn-helix transcriptional regulator [Alphaproteobacteria bacterium]|nr:helix-turn-helix transcriptional regulator [Alphaproteobacteria bacterium]
MRESDTVTLPRAEYETLLNRLDEAEDRATVAAALAREKTMGKKAARAAYLPVERLRELMAGEHPIRVWRRHRGLTREALAAKAAVSGSYLTEIETGKKPGSVDAVLRLARALDAPLDAIAAWIIKR